MKSVLERLRDLAALDESGVVSLVGPPMMAISAFDARWLLKHIELLELGVSGHVAPPPFTVDKPRLRLVGPAPADEPPDEPGGAA